ncbi:unnamed protein product [Prorocentrum cordatum]|uniref:Nuclear pore complex protein Nup85 n=1 Tax=Prorocentrum cordatum TaxID=2364126 RepID=A0ABN9RK73_9DINO|nr:unnamed protein product [Polarella glacialis]
MATPLLIFRSMGTVLEIHSATLGEQLVDKVVRSAFATAKHDIGDADSVDGAHGSVCDTGLELGVLGGLFGPTGGDTMCDKSVGECMVGDAGLEIGSMGCDAVRNEVTVSDVDSIKDIKGMVGDAGLEIGSIGCDAVRNDVTVGDVDSIKAGHVRDVAAEVVRGDGAGEAPGLQLGPGFNGGQMEEQSVDDVGCCADRLPSLERSDAVRSDAGDGKQTGEEIGSKGCDAVRNGVTGAPVLEEGAGRTRTSGPRTSSTRELLAYLVVELLGALAGAPTLWRIARLGSAPTLGNYLVVKLLVALASAPARWEVAGSAAGQRDFVSQDADGHDGKAFPVQSFVPAQGKGKRKNKSKGKVQHGCGGTATHEGEGATFRCESVGASASDGVTELVQFAADVAAAIRAGLLDGAAVESSRDVFFEMAGALADSDSSFYARAVVCGDDLEVLDAWIAVDVLQGLQRVGGALSSRAKFSKAIKLLYRWMKEYLNEENREYAFLVLQDATGYDFVAEDLDSRQDVVMVYDYVMTYFKDWFAEADSNRMLGYHWRVATILACRCFTDDAFMLSNTIKSLNEALEFIEEHKDLLSENLPPPKGQADKLPSTERGARRKDEGLKDDEELKAEDGWKVKAEDEKQFKHENGIHHKLEGGQDAKSEKGTDPKTEDDFDAKSEEEDAAFSFCEASARVCRSVFRPQTLSLLSPPGARPRPRPVSPMLIRSLSRTSSPDASSPSRESAR